ncbi:hypothetical protein FNQ90_19550 [Streptomyces alkaliphilus]|uniref:Uncharacterized protein n=1 Tax=Streptomyces alkaliphilus TaxID=1472722 RepID=A0A7W3TG69_9ACTN|nr:hypothetical protein [Streptomyces alkaliphilus]
MGRDPARVTAAEEFLSTLPGGWACGLKTARNLAPKLAEHTLRQGWDLTPELAAHLLRNLPERIHRRAGFLEGRIDDLERRDAVTPPRAAAGDGARCPQHPGREAASCLPCRAGDAPDPQAAPDMDPEAIEAIKAQLRGELPAAPRGRGERRPRRPLSRRAREAVQRREAEAFEEQRARALAGLEEHFPLDPTDEGRP